MSSYLDEILAGQSQSKITGRGALQPGQIEAAFQGDLAARYQAEAKSAEIGLQTKSEAAQESEFAASQAQQQSQFTQQLGLSTEAQQAQESQFSQSQAQQQSQFTQQLGLSTGAQQAQESQFSQSQAQQQSQFTAGQAQQASQFGQTMAYNQAALDAQQSIGKTQSIVSGVGAAGQAAIGGALAKQAFFPKTATPAPATGAATTGTEAALPVAEGGADALYGAEGLTQAAAPEFATESAVGAGTAATATGVTAAASGEALGAGAIETAGAGAFMDAAGGSFVVDSGLTDVVAEVAPAVATALATWVLCSELVRQGKLEQSIVDQEWSYIRETITNEEYSGYRIIADPLVRLMQNSKAFTLFMSPLIRAFAYEMASRVNPQIKGHWLGSFILWWGAPLCRFVSMIRTEVQYG